MEKLTKKIDDVVDILAHLKISIDLLERQAAIMGNTIADLRRKVKNRQQEKGN